MSGIALIVAENMAASIRRQRRINKFGVEAIFVVKNQLKTSGIRKMAMGIQSLMYVPNFHYLPKNFPAKKSTERMNTPIFHFK